MNSITMSLKDLRQFKGSLVYTLRRQGIVIYVGRSNVGIDRPLETFHHAMSQGLATDLIQLNFCKSASEAAKLERQLIHTYHPKLNVRKPAHKIGNLTKFKGGSCP